MRFLVTAAGAGPGISVTKAIKRHPLTQEAFVLAVDTSEDSAGLFIADQGELVPSADDPDYSEAILNLATKYDIGMVIPILDLEVPVLGASTGAFQDQGVVVAVDPPEVTTRALDKRAAVELCRSLDLQHPGTWSHPDLAPASSYPLIGKPIRGTGSKGVSVVAGPTDGIPHDDNTIWQSFISGREFSIDIWGDPDSSTFVSVPRWRRRVRDGQMVFGETVSNDALTDMARQVARGFGVRQVSCLQVIQDDSGTIHFIELNPRYGTGVSLTIEAGPHLPYLQWLAAYQSDKLESCDLDYVPGLKMIRYWEEHYYR